jgi:histidinol-phosphate aminotransferase
VRLRRGVEGVPAYGPEPSAEDGLRAMGVELRAKLDSNEGQFGPTQAARAAIDARLGALNRYPDHARALADRLGGRHGVGSDRILIGNGVDAIVGYLTAAYLEPGDEVVMGWPSFVTYRLDVLRCGAVPVPAPLRAGAYDLEAMAERIGARTKLVFVCNPNNPTGGIVTRDELDGFLARVPSHVLVVVDEAYHEYVDDDRYPDTVADHGGRANVAVLRTFSKLFGLAGLRAGYMVAAAPVVADVSRCRHWFDVTDLAHLAAAASLDDADEPARRRAATAEGRRRLADILRSANLTPLESHANFLYAEVGDGAGVAERLARRGVLVRSLEGFGAPAAIRVTVGTPDEHAALADALARVLPRG